MKIGDKVKLIGIPAGTRDDGRMQTRALFEKCLGKTFIVVGMDTFEGVPFELVRLDVGHVVGKESYLETIWVEPEYLQFEEG